LILAADDDRALELALHDHRDGQRPLMLTSTIGQ